MKFVNKEDFLKLPEGILFCEYSPKYRNLGEVCVKKQSIEDDFFYSPLFQLPESIVVAMARDTNYSFSLEDYTYRDGPLNSEHLYMIFETPDINAILHTLEKGRLWTNHNIRSMVN